MCVNNYGKYYCKNFDSWNSESCLAIEPCEICISKKARTVEESELRVVLFS